MPRVRYKEAAKHLNLPEGTLRALVSREQIPHIRIGPRCVLFDVEALDSWIASKTVAAK